MSSYLDLNPADNPGVCKRAHLPRALGGADDDVAAAVQGFGHVFQQRVQLKRHLRDQHNVHDACAARMP